MDRAGEPTGLVRRESVEEKTQSASWKVRISSTTMAWPGVVLLLSCKGRWVRIAFWLYGQGLGEVGVGPPRTPTAQCTSSQGGHLPERLHTSQYGQSLGRRPMAEGWHEGSFY